MCTTRGEGRCKKQHFKVKSVYTALTAPRLKQSRASLGIYCSCGSHTFRPTFVLVFCLAMIG